MPVLVVPVAGPLAALAGVPVVLDPAEPATPAPSDELPPLASRWRLPLWPWLLVAA